MRAQKLYLSWKIASIYSLLRDKKHQHCCCENLTLQWNYHETDSVHISVSSDQLQFARKCCLPSSGNRWLFTVCGVTGTNGQSYQWRPLHKAFIWKSIVFENKSCPTHALLSLDCVCGGLGIKLSLNLQTSQAIHALVLCNLITLCVYFNSTTLMLKCQFSPYQNNKLLWLFIQAHVLPNRYITDI